MCVLLAAKAKLKVPWKKNFFTQQASSDPLYSNFFLKNLDFNQDFETIQAQYCMSDAIISLVLFCSAINRKSHNCLFFVQFLITW